MNKGLIGSVLAALLMGVMVPASQADLFSIQMVGQGSSGGVGFSFLTTGTNNSGGGNNGAWRINGSILVNYDATGGAAGGGLVTLVGPANLTISDNTGTIGTLTINDLFLQDSNLSGGNLGHMDFSVASNGSNSTLDTRVASGNSGTIYYLDQNYGSSSNGFNSFMVDGSQFLSLRLWGNQTVAAGETPPGPNWGTDWSSGGGLQVPAPGAAFLGILGLGCVGLIRRRFA